MPRPPRKAKLSDIAARANISVPAVSMALADHPRISLQTKRKVLLISEQLGYRSPQRTVESASAGRSVKRLGFACIHGSLASPVNAALMMHLTTLASRHDIAMETLSTHDVADPKALAQRLVHFAKPLDGVILTGYVQQSTVSAVSKADVPLVVLGDPLDGTVADHVSFDFQAAGRQATAYLLAQGHCRVAFVCEIKVPGGANFHWHEGYLLAHHSAGIAPDPALTLILDDVPHDEAHRHAPQRVQQQLLQLPQPATALVVSNPFIAEALVSHFAAQRSAPALVTANLGLPSPSLENLPQIVLSHEVLAHHAFRRLLYLCRHPHDLPLRTLVPFQTRGLDSPLP